MAPDTSLPWVSALTITTGPGTPLSSTCTNSAPLVDLRQRTMSGKSNSIGWCSSSAITNSIRPDIAVSGSDHQQAAPIGHADGGDGAAVEGQAIGLDAVAEDHAVLGHQRGD